MASRERKRSDRQKRKARTAERRQTMSERTEQRNEAAREALEPLAAHERPTVLTVGAVLSAAICASIVIAYALGATVNGDRPHLLQVIAPALLIGVMAYGLWRVRYWAAMGFQAILALLALEAALGMVGATSLVQLGGNLVLIVGAGTLFFFMIKAMARIQMPERPES